MLHLTHCLKSTDHLILITDDGREKGVEDGSYKLGSKPAEAIDNAASRASGALAGSLSRMDAGVKNMMHIPDYCLDEVVHTTPTNPEKNPEVPHRKNTLTSSKDADLVILDEQSCICKAICRGQIAFDDLQQTANAT